MNVMELERTNRLASLRNQRKKIAEGQKQRINDLIKIADSVHLHHSFNDYNAALRIVSKAEGILETLVQLDTLTLPEYERLMENILGAEARINYLIREKRRLYQLEWKKPERRTL